MSNHSRSSSSHSINGTHAAVMKFNLVHRTVFQNIVNNDSRIQQRALSILYQTIQDPSKRSIICNLSTKEIQEFTDLLQVPILLPLQSFRRQGWDKNFHAYRRTFCFYFLFAPILLFFSHARRNS